MTAIKAIMQTHKTNAGEISRHAHISRSTVYRALKRPPGSWSINLLKAFANGLNISPAALLCELDKDNKQ